MTASRPVVFLDVDGVLLDEARTPLEWIRLIGDVLAPALGGTPDDWGRANAAVFPGVFADRADWYDADPFVSERSLIRKMIRAECAFVGVPYPGDATAERLGRELDVYVCANSDSAFPETVPVLRELARDHVLHTATGNPSWRVTTLLEQWDARDLIGVPAGPDLVGAMKDTTTYYERVFALARTPPSRAVVVDDSSSHLRRAKATGARTVLVDSGGTAGGAAHVDATITGIGELPAALRRLS